MKKYVSLMMLLVGLLVALPATSFDLGSFNQEGTFTLGAFVVPSFEVSPSISPLRGVEAEFINSKEELGNIDNLVVTEIKVVHSADPPLYMENRAKPLLSSTLGNTIDNPQLKFNYERRGQLVTHTVVIGLSVEPASLINTYRPSARRWLPLATPT